MKIVRISALWCSACLVTNKAWKKLQENYDFEALNLDIDMNEEEVKNYNKGDILPVWIIENNNKEIKRLEGEYSYEELEKILKEVLDDEKNN